MQRLGKSKAVVCIRGRVPRPRSARTKTLPANAVDAPRGETTHLVEPDAGQGDRRQPAFSSSRP
jgi:hypothetical protein